MKNSDSFLKTTLLQLTLLILVLHPLSAKPASKALLIGLSQYQYPASFSPSISNLNLEGTDQDIMRMHTFSRQLGISTNNIITLTNETATEQNIKQVITQQLVNGVKSSDRVLIYFSGHGSTIWDEDGDELDNQDEVLLTYDAHFELKSGKYKLVGKIIDDEISTLLSAIPSKRLLFIVDSCHSGNINKSIITDSASFLSIKYANNPHLNIQTSQNKMITHSNISDKSLRHRGLIETIASQFGYDHQPITEEGRVFFSATNETGKALTGKQGSIFTASLSSGLANILSDNQSSQTRVDLNYLKKWVFNDLRSRYPNGDSEPQLFGDQKLIDLGF